jgi:outer membrane immunogenic protein
MYLIRAALLILFAAIPVALHGQATPTGGSGYGLEGDGVPRMEAGFNYNYIRANAPPGQCGCFGFNGGSASFTYNVNPTWAAVADLAVGHASNVDGTSQVITIINYFFGGRYTKRNHTRWVPYGQVLFGGAKEDVNFDFTINRQSLGFMGGGGVTRPIRNHFAVTVVEVDYVYTRIPNAKGNSQNNTRVLTGIIYRF